MAPTTPSASPFSAATPTPAPPMPTPADDLAPLLAAVLAYRPQPPSLAAAGLPPACPVAWPVRRLGPLDPMKPNPPAAPVEPVLLFIAVAWLAAKALAALLIVALAVALTLAGWRPAPAPVLAPALGPPSSRLEPDVSAMGAASSA